MRMYVFPWDQLSEGATALSRALGVQKLLRKGSGYGPQRGDLIVNWGASDIDKWMDQRVNPERDGVTVLNRSIKGALDKLEFFDRTLASAYVPGYTLDRDEAELMIEDGNVVVCRTKIKGRDGDGIVVAERVDQLVDAKLYVELIEQTAEYRVHVGRDAAGKTSIIGVQRKFRPNGEAKGDPRIRTTANGCYFVWTVKDVPVIDTCGAAVKEAAIDVFDRFPELTFGGLDVIVGRDGRAFVLEINSAPELTAKTAGLYADFIKAWGNKPALDVGIDVVGPQQLDYAGEKLPVGQLRDPIEPQPEYLESDRDYVARNIDLAVRLLEAAGVQREKHNAG